MTNETARLIAKTDKHTGKEVFAVGYVNRFGQNVQTMWTTHRDEACAWGRIIQAHGYCMSGGELNLAA